MNRSLTPLIVSFAIIILLTIIMLHTRPQRPQDVNMPVFDLAPAMRLSPYPGRRTAPAAPSPETAAGPTHSARGTPDPDHLLDRSRRLLSEGKEAEAEDQLRTLLVFSPDSPPALSLLGGILFYSRRYDEAESVYRRQLRVDPISATLHNNLASVLARQGRLIEATAAAERALEIEPESAPPHINLAGIHAAAGDRGQALAHFQLAYERLGWRILPVAEDPVFRDLRNDPAFTLILAQARQDWEAAAGTPPVPPSPPTPPTP
jgi:Flp pilus assembly protein TadD